MSVRVMQGVMIGICVLVWAGLAHAERAEKPEARPSIAEAEARLQRAYRKEFAFLETEKTTLERRLAEVKRQAGAEERQALARLEAMQRRLVALTVEADELAEGMVELEREAEGALEGVDALESLAQQMSRAFEPYDLAWPPAELAPRAEPDEAPPIEAAEVDEATEQAAEVARLARLLSHGFETMAPLVARQAGLQISDGVFFLANGQQVKGQLIRAGGVAVYGVSPEGAGALTPAGAGRFKLDPVQGEATARALAAGEAPTSMGVFFFENTKDNYEARKAKTPQEIVEAGGAIAWVIVALGAVGLLLILLRALLLILARSPTLRMIRETESLIHERRYEEAADLIARRRGAGARLLSAVARALRQDRDDLERVFAERMIREEGRLDRFGAALMVIAAVAPLLGLLGTVTGMISTFDVITEFGTGNPKLLSGGISEALITTELGLVVAIPTLLLGNLLNSWARQLKADLEEGALKLVNLARVGPSGGAGEPTPEPDAAAWPNGAPEGVPS